MQVKLTFFLFINLFLICEDKKFTYIFYQQKEKLKNRRQTTTSMWTEPSIGQMSLVALAMNFDTSSNSIIDFVLTK